MIEDFLFFFQWQNGKLLSCDMDWQCAKTHLKRNLTVSEQQYWLIWNNMFACLSLMDSPFFALLVHLSDLFQRYFILFRNLLERKEKKNIWDEISVSCVWIIAVTNVSKVQVSCYLVIWLFRDYNHTLLTIWHLKCLLSKAFICKTAAEWGATYSFHQAFQCGILQHQRIKHLLCLLADVQQNCADEKHKRDKILFHWGEKKSMQTKIKKWK